MRRFYLLLLAGVVLLVLNAGCIGQPSAVSLDIQSFSVNPVEIYPGEPATLSWKVSGATSVSIDQNIGQVDSAGTITVSPQKTTTYKLTAKNSAAANSSTQTLTVKDTAKPQATGSGTNIIRRDFKPPSINKANVSSAVKPKIESFMVSPGSIWKGDSASLFWVVKDAKSISIDNSIGTVPETGTRVVKPGSDTKYILTAKNDFGTDTREVTLDIKIKAPKINVVGGSDSQTGTTDEPAQPPVIVDYTVAPDYSLGGLPVNLFWNVTGADSIAIKAMCTNPYTMKQYAGLPVYNNLPASSSMPVSMDLHIWGSGQGADQQWVYLRLTATNKAGVTERDVAVLVELSH